MSMGYSDLCPDQTTRWHRETGSCLKCKYAPGREITPNCGYGDDGSLHDVPHKPCKNNTYNEGWEPYCKPCSQCLPGTRLTRPCNKTADSLCEAQNQPMTSSSSTAVLWAVPFAISVAILLAVLAFIYVRSRKSANNLSSVVTYKDLQSPGASSCTEPSDLLCPQILSAPLQRVLDRLDVLEDLVILLDPESHGVKNTKHLASLCSFSSTWITYTYSMKDSKSPLKAVLEGITSRHPDWTVRHLAEMLRVMKRHDAIAVLGNLDVNKLDV